MTTHAGYAAIIGRPNVGKSTLMNHLIGQKLSITSRKPQTTRHQITGVLTEDQSQVVFVDTPGLHINAKRLMNQRMNDAAANSLAGVDLAIFVVDADKWTEDDELALQRIKAAKVPTLAVINKIDTMKNKSSLLPLIEKFSALHSFCDIVPVAALRNNGLDQLKMAIFKQLPEQDFFFDADELTDKSERFIAAEVIREKIMRTCGHEVPYDLTVQIEGFRDEDKHFDEDAQKWRRACTYIEATIFVERPGQKQIILGPKGARLKQIGTDARTDLEEFFGRRIMLSLWIKVKRGWSDDARALASFGL